MQNTQKDTQKDTRKDTRILLRNQIRLGYEISGEGPAILLGHSLLCSTRMWDGIAPELAKNYTVINIDARGHAGSTAPGPFTLDDLAQDWIAIMDKENIQNAILCGLSMGGMTAMRAALIAPERVRAMILMDTSAEPELMQKRIEYAAMLEILLRFGHLNPLYKVIGKIMLSKTTIRERPQMALDLYPVFKQHDPHQLQHAVRAVIDRHDLLSRIPEIHTPTLVLVGEEDTATPPFRSERLASALPKAILQKVPAAGHLSALEQPQIVLRQIEAFLKGIS